MLREVLRVFHSGQYRFYFDTKRSMRWEGHPSEGTPDQHLSTLPHYAVARFEPFRTEESNRI